MIVFGDLLKRNATRHPRKLGLVEPETQKRYTHEQFNVRVNKLANALSHYVEKGDRIGILTHNCAEFLELYGACAKLGTPIVPINFRLTAPEVAYIIENASPKVLLVGTPYVDVINTVRDKYSKLFQDMKILCIGPASNGMESYEKLLETASESEPTIKIDENDVFIICYTTGTTGKPKGCMITHKNVLADCVNHIIERQLSKEHVMFAPGPLFHMGVNCQYFASIYLGGTMVVAPYEPSKVIDIIEKERVTHVELFPGLLYPILDLPGLEKRDLSSVKSLLYGASPIAVERLIKAIEIFQCNFFQVYGMTEASPMVTALLPEDHVIEGPDSRRLKSCGREMINVEVRVVDEQDKDVPPDMKTIGEIIVKSPNIMKGYWQQPEATANAIKNGWYYSGDMAITDEEGYIYIVDRKKDIIISGSENISSVEVENTIFQYPKVRDVAVIGVADEKWGEAVKAVVVAEEGVEITADDIIYFCRNHLARYKCPKSVSFVKELPRSSTGKVLKTELRQQFKK